VSPHIFFDPQVVPLLDPLTLRLRDQVARLGFELVDARIAGPASRRSIRLRIDRPGSQPGAGVTSQDCTLVSRALLQWFEGEVPGESVDALEVSSPGIERPVRWPEHWRRFVGERVKVRAPALPGRPVGVIREVPYDAHVVVEFEGIGSRTLALADILEATLVVDWSRAR
jgi:ribosome maturation factor RimP